MTRLGLERLSQHHQAHVKKALRLGETFKKPRAEKPTAFGEEFDSKLELDFAAELEGWKLRGLIEEWRYHPLRFRIARGCTYEPDFISRQGARFIVYEVKGSWLGKNARDSRTRLQVAAYLYQWFSWQAVTRVKGVWHFEDIHSTDAEVEPME
jgi:hypothetical protein